MYKTRTQAESLFNWPKVSASLDFTASCLEHCTTCIARPCKHSAMTCCWQPVARPSPTLVIKYCTLPQCMITEAVLCLQPALEQLAFQNVGCSINACMSLAELVQNAQELKSMRLYNNMSDDAGAAAIAKVGLSVAWYRLSGTTEVRSIVCMHTIVWPCSDCHCRLISPGCPICGHWTHDIKRHCSFWLPACSICTLLQEAR